MPYQSTQDLPGRVKKNLSGHAQKINKESFHNAHQQYQDESRAHAVAWVAVKKDYTKTDGQWIKK